MANQSTIDLFRLLKWVREEGGPIAFSRLRLKLLPQTMSEGLCLDTVQPQTECSKHYLEAAHQLAESIVGRSYS